MEMNDEIDKASICALFWPDANAKTNTRVPLRQDHEGCMLRHSSGITTNSRRYCSRYCRLHM